VLPNELPFIAVKWGDAWGDAATTITPQNAHETHKPEVITTFGFLVYENEKGIRLASEYCDDGSYRGTSFIPRGIVIDVIPIKLSKARKPKKCSTSSSPSLSQPPSTSESTQK
jgi:hypothetical protein